MSETFKSLKPWIVGNATLGGGANTTVALPIPGAFFALCWFTAPVPADADIDLTIPTASGDTSGPYITLRHEKTGFILYNTVKNYTMPIKYIIFHNRAD
ncbi:hypothetical protein [Consotaella salsifontis]|uniref:Uncharacterized protein n=1 Tax=Consotaella salsifontis TaxID=1365950 RepID=A0A1T4SSW4_9HYPH|nr:hypothetical protein [Consotaella salsifontis]SKA30968.1 hypothetical protein SAMN05428963_11392 [Consotaella salsifontis]